MNVTQLVMLGAAIVVLSIQTCTLNKQNNNQQKPNIIILQADDLGWDDLSIHGNKIVETPHLDAFARESKRFSHFYVNPVCAPTRSSLLTGRHFLKTGVSHVHGGKDFIHLDETIFAETFRNAGFATGMWGKWHSGIPVITRGKEGLMRLIRLNYTIIKPTKVI